MNGVVTNATDWRDRRLQGKLVYQGLPISVENERGSYRQGTDSSGTLWRSFMHLPYGYIRLTEGTDGDHVDCYVGPDRFSDKVFVVHQQNPDTKRYDEDKVMLGFSRASDAKAAYVRQYDRPGFFQSMDAYDMATFKWMLEEKRGMKLKKSIDMEKAKKAPIGTKSTHGGQKVVKTAQGWEPVGEEKGAATRDPEDVRGSAQGYGTHNIQTGDTVSFKFEGDDLSGRVTATSTKGATVVSKDGRQFSVSWDSVTDFKGKGGTRSGVDPGSDLGDLPVPPEDFVANEWAAQFDDPNLTAEDIFAEVEKTNPDIRKAVEEAEARLEGIEQTIARHRTGGEGAEAVYSEERATKHDKIFNHFLSEENIKNAMPPEGQKPTLVMLGGRGGSGKSWFKDQVYDPSKAIVLDADEIKGMLDEYEGWNAFQVHEESSDILEMIKDSARSLGLNVVIDATLKTPKSAQKNADVFADAGYDIEVHYMHAPRKIAAQRAMSRFTGKSGRYVPVGVILGNKENEKSFELIKQQASVWSFRDSTGGPPPKLVSAFGKGKFAKAIRGLIAMLPLFKASNVEDTTDEREIREQAAYDFYDFRTPTPENKYSDYMKKKIEELRKKKEAILGKKEPEETKKSMSGLDSGPLLVKSYDGMWFLHENGVSARFYWFHGLEKFTKAKTYYSPEEIKARGMRWVTIRGARVLLQGTSDGGYVVVGGAGGKLNHLKIDKVLSREDYTARRRQVEKKRKEDLRTLTREEIAEQAQKRKQEVTAKKEARAEYTEKVTGILGVTPDDLRSQITAKEMDEITDKARKMVENLMKKKTVKDVEGEVEKAAEEIAKKEAAKKVKDIERAALETLMEDYMPQDPNAKSELKKLIDTEKATQILSERKAFQKRMREIAKGQVDFPTKLKVGDVYAAASQSLPGEIEEEIRQQVETLKNVEMYDRMNAQSASIQKQVDQGSISALNGLLGDVYGSGATFSTDTVENLGLEAVVRAVTIKLQQDGKGEIVRRALEEYSMKERQQVVDRAIKEYDRRMQNAENLRNLARDADDAEAVLSMASANGHALKQITAAQRALGTAVGSLRAVSHMMNALEDPPADVVQIDIGKDLSRAREKAKKAGLLRGDYSIKTMKEGRAKRLVLEIPKDSIDRFMAHSESARKDESTIAKIKRHEMNTGYTPPGSLPNFKLSDAQEAGLHFFKENKRVLLDFEAGLGKTAMAYAAIAEARHNMGAKKVLIVTPAKLRGQFKDHGKKYVDKETLEGLVASTEGITRSERRERYARESGIHIISQDLLREDADLVKNAGYDMVVVDEIHEMTAGTGQAGRFKALMDIADIPLKVAMSGTNIKNKKEELYRKINFIDPEHTLGSASEFKKRYDGLNQGTGMFADAANDAFRKEMAPYMYTQKNVLPVENREEVERVPLTPQQRREYAASERQYRDARDRGVPGASAQRDSRNYAIVTNGDPKSNAKLNKMVDIINSKHPGEKAVIHVSSPGKPILHAIETAKTRLESEYGPGTVGVIKGGDSNNALKKLKARFNDPDDPLRFIIGSKSLESGHNLQHGGTVTFHLDMPDSHAVKQQREARVFRRGQDKDTNTYTLSGLNPLDMRAEDIVETKRREMGILGNPRSVDAMDDTGFIGILNRHEAEATGGTVE